MKKSIPSEKNTKSNLLHKESKHNDSDDNDTNQEELSNNKDPFFVMTLEFEKGKYKKIKIFPTSDPTDLAYTFCLENKLDYSSLKYLVNEISILLEKYKAQQLNLSPGNDSIEEVEEEMYQSDKTKSHDKTVSQKHLPHGKFIYSSIDSVGILDELNKENDKGEEQKEGEVCYQDSKEHFANKSMPGMDMMIMKNYKPEEKEEKDDSDENVQEEEENVKEENNDDSNDDNKEDVVIEGDYNDDNDYLNNSDNSDNPMNIITHEINNNSEPIEMNEESSIEIPSENKSHSQSKLKSQDASSLVPNKQSLISYQHKANGIFSTDIHDFHDNNPLDSHSIKKYSSTQDPMPYNPQTKKINDKMSELIKMKLDKEAKAKQLQKELEREEQEKQSRLLQQQLLEKEDQIEREEYIQYEKQQAKNHKQRSNKKAKSSKQQNTKSYQDTLNSHIDQKEKKFIMSEIDYNFPSDKEEQPLNKPNTDIKQNDSPKEALIQPIIIPQPKAFSNELLTEQNITYHHIPPSNISTTQKKTNNDTNRCVTACNLLISSTIKESDTNNTNNQKSFNKEHYSMIKPEMTHNRCISSSNSNVFEKLYNDAEIKQKLPKRPCHFSSRYQQGIIINNSLFRCMTNSHMRINSNDPSHLETEHNNKPSKTALSSSRLISPHHPHQNISSYSLRKGQPKRRNNQVIREYGSYMTDMNSNFKGSFFSTSMQNKMMITDYSLKHDDNNYNNNYYKSPKQNSDKSKPLKYITKSNLFNPYLKRKVQELSKEFKEVYTFKPKINHNYNFEPKLSFLERQEIYDEIHQSYRKEINQIVSPSHSKSKSKPKPEPMEYPQKTRLTKYQSSAQLNKGKQSIISKFNIFKRNQRNHIDINKYLTNQPKHCNNKKHGQEHPLKCKCETNEVFNKKKEEAFMKLFRELDSDEDGILTSIGISTKTIPDNIIALITPLLNHIKSGLYQFDYDSFAFVLDELYQKMPLSDKRMLIEHFSSKSRKDIKTQQNQFPSSQYKAYADNDKTQKMVENHDKRVSQSFSQNNISLTKPAIIQHKAYFKSLAMNDIMKKNQLDTYNKEYGDIQKYTFQTYKSNLSYNY